MSDDDLLSENPDTGEPDDAAAQRTENAASPRRYRSKKQRAEFEKREGEAFWRHCLATPAGRRELYRFIESCGFGKTEFACGPNGFPQTEATWFKLGIKDVGESLFHKLATLDRAGTFLMLDEHDPRYAARRIAPKDE